MRRRDFLKVPVAAAPVLTGFRRQSALPAGRRVRARDLGIVTGDIEPGPLNAITDVEGVLVGHETIVRGEGTLEVGKGPARVGVRLLYINGLSVGPATS